MASKRDLVEAHDYNRRRLITAFVSGAPGGREVEPVRYARTLVGGLVLALLVVAGAAVSGFIQQPVPKNWAEEGLVVGKDSGSRFFAFKGTLYPVINITSAKLLLKPGTKPTVVPDKLISAKTPDSTIGISGAPEVLPDPGNLVQDGWSACTNGAKGVAVTVSAKPPVTAARNQAFRVTDGKDEYVVAGGHRYPVAGDSNGQLALRALALDSEPARGVPGLWLDLLPLGTALEAPAVAGAGETVQTGVPDLTAVGTPVTVEGGNHYVLAQNGHLLELSDFAFSIYSSGRTVAKVSSSDSGKLTTDPGSSAYPADWPTDAVTPYTAVDQPCLQLDTTSGGKPVVGLATDSSGDAGSNDAEITRRVGNGAGAVVRAVTAAGVLNTGPVYLIDGSGTSFAVGPDGNGAALGQLGYGSLAPRPVPKAWLTLFQSGPELSAEAAGRTPGSQQ